MKKILLITTFLLATLFSWSQVPANDNCNTAQNLGTLPVPAACPSGIGTAVNVVGTNINATAPNPYTTLLGCQSGGNQPGPALDVWYSFVASGNQVNINITPGAAPLLANPAITLWRGTCAGLIGVNCDNNGTAGGNNTAMFQPVTLGVTYFIQISGMNNITSGNFNMSVNATNDCNNCLQNSNLTVNPLPVNGTYAPGTTVNFCYNITQYTQVSANWLHGVIPTFGCGWDLTTLTTTPPASCGGSGTWGWYNTWTSSANASVWGPGFAFNYTLPADANPGNNFGDLCSTPNWNFCWSVKTKVNCAGCTNLNISINTTGDGESGSWTSIACLGDPNYQFAAVMSCCTTTAAATNILCFGGVGSATATPTGSAPFTYTWNSTPVQNTQVATNLPAGNYTVTVKDNNNCISTATVTVTQPPNLTIGTLTVNATCSQLNGSAVASPLGGVGPYTYTWSTTPVQNTQAANNLGAGIYTVTVKDANNCIKTATVMITSTGSITTTAASTSVSCFGGVGSATATPLGGGPYTYTWNSTPVQNTQVATNLPVGIYTVTVNSLGCLATATVNITQPPILNASITSTNVTCFGGSTGSASVSPSGGVGPYTYTWTSTPVQNTALASNLPAGTYTVTVKDLNGCIKTASVIITQPTQIVVTTTVVNTTCGLPNGSATANPLGGVGPYTYLWSNGQTTQTAINLLSGIYTVTVTGVGGCTATAVANVLNTGAPTVTIPTTVNVSCFGGNNGSANSNVVGGVGPFTYTWNSIPVQNTPNATNLTAGNYTLTVTGSNGCSATSTVTITQPTSLTVTGSQTNVSCFGGNNGSATVTPAGGTPGYTYTWTTVPVQNTAVASNLPAGNYTVTITDTKGCQITKTYTITQPPLLTTSTTQTNVTCFGGNNGSASVTPVGGTGPYTYTWTTAPVQNTAQANTLTTGNYTVTVTDSKGCTSTSSVVITQPTQITSTTSMTISTCGQANGSASVNPVGGVGPYTYLWSNGGITQTINGLLPGVYSVTITGVAGCTATNNISVTSPNSPTLSIPSKTNVSCFGGNNGSANSNVIGGVGPFTYTWNSIPVQNTANAVGLVAGNYTLTVTDFNGCQSTATVTITQPTQLVSSITTTNVSCFGGSNGSAMATPNGGTGPYTYTWTSAPVQNTQIASNLPTGTYSCTVTDSKGCQIIVSANIVQPAQLVTSILSQTNISCFGGNNGVITTSVTGGVGPNYLYSLNAGPNQLSPTFNGLPAGIYMIVVTDQNGCTKTVTTTLTQPPALTINGSITNILCFNVCNGQTSVNVGGGTPGYTYNWSNGGNTNPIVSLCAGTYSVIVTDLNGCQIALTGMSVSQPSSLTINPNASPATICVGQSSNLNSNVGGGTGPYTYNWSNGGTTSNISVSPTVTTNYTVNVTDANGCTISSNITVVVNTNLNGLASSAPSTVCAGQSSTISANANGGNGGPYTFVWSPGGSGQTIGVTPSATTVYTVTISDGCSPVITATTTVVVNARPTVTYTTTPLLGCVPLTVKYTNTTPNSSNCLWMINNIPYTSCTTSQTYSTPGTYSAMLTVTDNNGCSNTSNIIVANAQPVPVAQFTLNPKVTDIMSPTVEFTNLSTPGSNSWSFGDGSTSIFVSPIHTYSEIGTYTVQLVVTTQAGCSDVAYSTVIINDIFAVYVPNAITPNDDGRNDVFYPVVTGAEFYEFWIFDRWGEQIYYSTKAGTPWDGKYKGEFVKDDVYVWKLHIKEKISPKTHDLVGHVTIIK